MKLENDELQDALIASVVEHIAQGTPVAVLDIRFSLPFSEKGSDAALMLVALKAIIHRVVARPYAQCGRQSLIADLVAAELNQAAAEWICQAVEKAALPHAQSIRKTQAHLAAALSSSYLQDFDWQVTHLPLS